MGGEERKETKSELRVLEKILPEWLRNKTEVCKHEHGCFENVISEALTNFMFGFGF